MRNQSPDQLACDKRFLEENLALDRDERESKDGRKSNITTRIILAYLALQTLDV